MSGPCAGFWHGTDAHGNVRKRRADARLRKPRCAHRACWSRKRVIELTRLLREGPAGDQFKVWPAAMRVFARPERPHPGGQLTLFEAEDGWRYSLWATNRPPPRRAGTASAPTLMPRTGSCTPPPGWSGADGEDS